jgi:Membrane protein involved in the export of O-antigen and teichoic acid
MTLINNAKWVAISQFSRVGLQLLGMLFLARLLGPAEYGVMAIATVVVNLANLLRDLGTSAAVIQRSELDEDAKATVFWINLGVGFVLATIVAGTAGLIGRIFNSSHLPQVLGLLAFSFPLTACSAVHQALLERNSRFRLAARIEILSSATGLSVAVLLAHLHFGVFCLPAQILSAAALSSIQLWISSRWYPKGKFNRRSLSSVFSYSGNLAAFNFINYFARNADSIVIGKLLGPIQLGVYSQAYRIMLFPLQNMTFVATRALFPILSRHQSEPLVFRDLYLKTVLMVMTITGPLMGGIWVLRTEFVHFVFGGKWNAVIPILAWLAPVGFLQSVVSTTGTVFMATGKTKTLMNLGVVATILQVGAFFIGAMRGVNCVAAMYFVANLVNFFIAMNWTMRHLNSSLTFLLFTMTKPLMSSVVMVILMIFIRNWLVENGVEGLYLAMPVAVIGLVIYVVTGLGWIRGVIYRFPEKRA